MEWNMPPVGIQTGLVIDDTAGGKTLTVPTAARAALITVYGAPIRFWTDGTAPTNATGHRADVYDQIELPNRKELVNFKAIREGGTNATLEVTYYG